MPYFSESTLQSFESCQKNLLSAQAVPFSRGRRFFHEHEDRQGKGGPPECHRKKGEPWSECSRKQLDEKEVCGEEKPSSKVSQGISL